MKFALAQELYRQEVQQSNLVVKQLELKSLLIIRISNVDGVGFPGLDVING